MVADAESTEGKKSRPRPQACDSRAARDPTCTTYLPRLVPGRCSWCASLLSFHYPSPPSLPPLLLVVVSVWCCSCWSCCSCCSCCSCSCCCNSWDCVGVGPLVLSRSDWLPLCVEPFIGGREGGSRVVYVYQLTVLTVNEPCTSYPPSPLSISLSLSLTPQESKEFGCSTQWLSCEMGRTWMGWDQVAPPRLSAASSRPRLSMAHCSAVLP